jgi:hypothetical protein
MALTAGKQLRALSAGHDESAPGKASDIVYAGGIVMLDASGRAINGTAATGSIGVGLALTNRDLDRYDGTGKSDGDLTIRWQEGIMLLKNSGSQPFLSSDQPGIIAYIEDNQTVSKTDQSSTLSVAGLFHHLDSDGAWVTMGKTVGALAKDMVTVTDAAAAHLAGSETFTGVKTFANSADPVFAKEAAHTVNVVTTTTAATAGGALTVAAGQGATSGTGGAISVAGGAGGSSGIGGAATLVGGAGGSSSGAGGAANLHGGAATAGVTNGGAVDIQGGAKSSSGTDGAIAIGTSHGAVTIGASGTILTINSKQASGASTNTIADPGTGVAIPVTASGVCPLTIGSAGAESNSLADPTFMGQMITIVADTVGSGTRAVTAASVINGANNTIMTFNAVRDQIVLQAITVAGALKWSIILNISVTLS